MQFPLILNNPILLDESILNPIVLRRLPIAQIRVNSIPSLILR